MPETKNAIIRYKYLDDLLSDRHHYYSTREIWEKCRDRLSDNGYGKVTLRCIQKDLIFLTSAPFYAEIERYRAGGRLCIRYKKDGYSIFKKELSDEEASLLREALATLGQFDGLDNFTWLDDFRKGLELAERRPIISFSHNPYLKNSNMLGTLFDDISNQVVVRLSYHTFNNETTRSIDFHPYLLKQYNDRWYVIGEKDEKIQKLISQLEYLKRKLWGKMSEKSSLPNDPRQLEIDFGEVKLTEEEKNAAKAAAQEVEADREARKVTVRSYEKYGTLNQVIRNLAVDVLNDMADDNLDHEAVKQKRPNKKLSK